MTQKMTLLWILLVIIGNLTNADKSNKKEFTMVSTQHYVRDPSEWKSRVVYQY